MYPFYIHVHALSTAYRFFLKGERKRGTKERDREWKRGKERDRERGERERKGAEKQTGKKEDRDG